LILVELANSAIEAVVDRIGDGYHELSGRAKDMGSAMVFTAICIVVLSWATLLLQKYVFG
jgi:diacylglycerol kinase (ATP)